MLLCIVLAVFLGKCQGQTRFIYPAKYEEKLTCETNKWVISRRSDNRISLNCSAQCKFGEYIEFIDDDEYDERRLCTNKDPQSDRICTLEVESGFFACVKSLDSDSLYPFNPSPGVIRSYVVAVRNTKITLKSEERSSQTVIEGQSVFLNCGFTFRKKQKSFIVYWIKTTGTSSTCVYSYEHLTGHSSVYNHHCNVQENLRKRLLNQARALSTHNIRIREVRRSDSGQYLCALQVKGDRNRVKWTVVKNVTVRVNTANTPTKPTTSTTSTTSTTPTTSTTSTTGTKPGGDSLMPLYTSWPVCLCLLLTVWVAFAIIKKKANAIQASQAMQLQRNEETLDADSSSYAAGNGEAEN